MHEVSVATGIVDVVLRVLKEHGRHRAASVKLVIGALTCVDDKALRFALDSATKGTMMEGAEVFIERPEPLAVCRNCRHEFQADGFVTSCPECGNFDAEIIRGRELFVQSVEAE
ncbi:MAG: hydrogenase maturation nickel metallochaperone HypA [Bacteroidales bacterium]